MSQSFHLFQLQKIDSQIDQNDRRMVEIEKIISDVSQQKLFQETRRGLQQKFDDLAGEMKKLEDDIAHHKIKIEQSNSSLFSGKIINPKELQDLQNEIASVKKNVAFLEEEQLQQLILLESAENELNAFDKMVVKEQGESITKNSGLQGESSKLDLQNQNLRKEKEIIRNQIPPASLSTYEQLRAKKKGIAVSEIVDSVCNACGSELTPAECQKARSPQSVTFCGSCGRILYLA
jgi:predicted  nucleic acid-binding Zn-ribbon protein